MDSKLRVTIHVPGQAEPTELSLAVGETALVGREPDLSQPLPGRAIAHTVASPNVSGSQAWITADADGVRVCDLQSTNGTALRLPAMQPVSLPNASHVELHLAPVLSAPSGELPEDAYWKTHGDFSEALVARLQAWFAARHVPVRLFVDEEGPTDNAAINQIPLVNGAALHVLPTHTLDASWQGLLADVWRFVARQNALLVAENESRKNGMVIASPSLKRAFRQVIDAARSGLRVMVLGPSGAGKEELARCYHRESGRSGSLVALNCSMFSKDLLRAELFGAEKGAFTGSVQRMVGAVERADGGTLFLDEIADIPSEVQPMLLRFLDRGEYSRLGQYADHSLSDARVVCAANKDLRAATSAGSFRLDLWFRLAQQVVDLPPLCDRPEDLSAYLEQQALRPGVSLYDALSEGALSIVRAHRWDGNFRELLNFAQRLRQQSTGDKIIDETRCREALAQGAISLMPVHRPALPASDWIAQCQVAADAFSADFAKAMPETWDEVKDYVEKYLKPLLFAHLSGTESKDFDLQTVARTLGADRGTARKQLDRYFERFS